MFVSIKSERSSQNVVAWEARHERPGSGLAADDATGPRVDIDDNHLVAVHEFQRIDHPLRNEAGTAEIGHVAIGRMRAHLGDQPTQRDHLSLCRRLAQIFLVAVRSEEHTSELQSLMRISYAVFCLNKKTNLTEHRITTHLN